MAAIVLDATVNEVLIFPLLALLIAGVIVWWTMFSGRPRGELPPPEDDKPREGTEPEPREPPRT
jgi:hypothetical protein